MATEISIIGGVLFSVSLTLVSECENLSVEKGRKKNLFTGNLLLYLLL